MRGCKYISYNVYFAFQLLSFILDVAFNFPKPANQVEQILLTLWYISLHNGYPFLLLLRQFKLHWQLASKLITIFHCISIQIKYVLGLRCWPKYVSMQGRQRQVYYLLVALILFLHALPSCCAHSETQTIQHNCNLFISTRSRFVF